MDSGGPRGTIIEPLEGEDKGPRDGFLLAGD